MPQFRYRANAPDGAALEDVMDAPSAHEVVQRLQERGYAVTLVEPLQAEFARAGRGRQLPWTDLELFAQQLHSITSRNLPLAPGLQALAQGMPNGPLRGVVDQVRIDLERGASAEEALRNRGNALPPLFARVVRAGEAANGGLPEVLRILVQHSARMVALQNTLRSALAYPILVLAVLLAVVGYLMYTVLPLYNDLVYREASREFSDISFIDWLKFSPGLIFGAFVLVGMGALYATSVLQRTYASSVRTDRIKLAVPRFGRVYYLITVARFSRTLASLLAARVPVVEAMELSGAASGSLVLQQAVADASNRVAMGESLANALEASHYFEPTYSWLLGSSEQRNAAEEALNHLAEACEREAFAQDSLNTQLIGPLALVAVGLVFFAVSSQFMVGQSSVLSGM